MYEYLNRRYALALYEIAEGKGKVKEYLDELEQVVNAINKDTEFLKIMEYPEISTADKKKMFTEIFKGKINEDIFSFLLVLIEKGRIDQLNEKFKEMKDIYLEKHNTVVAKVKTVIPLQESEKEFEAETGKEIQQKVLIEDEIDPNIIGGVYIDVNNEVIDGTIRSKLSEMKKIMLKGEQR